MSKTPCKGIRKDGSPCQGNGLDQFDGYCIAHAPADLTREWRSRGGKNSATAARLDKRIPERLKQAIDLVHDSMNRVLEGTISPAACNAACRSAKTLVDLYRLADEEMDLIRTEETQSAAAQLAGAPANPDILAAADTITTQLAQYRAESLVDQGFAELNEPDNPDEPSEVVLNDRGRRRFGYHHLDVKQQMLNEVEDQLEVYAWEQSDEYDGERSDLPDVHEITDLLDVMEKDIAETRSRLACPPAAPFDPLTGQPFTALPARVKPKAKPSRLVRIDDSPQEVMAAQLNQIKELKRITHELSQDEDYQRKWAIETNTKRKREELGVFLDDYNNNGRQFPIVPATAAG